MRKVAFLVLPEFSSLGLAAAIEPLFIANWLAQREIFSWRMASVDGDPVLASNGRLTVVDGGLAAAADCKTVFVLASFDPHRAIAQRAAVRWLARIAKFGVEIGGIENGTWLLAEAGLLKGHQTAVHWDNSSGFQEQYPKNDVVSQLFARSRGRVTCAGASAVLDMMIAWIGWHADTDLAAEVADHLVLGRPRSGDTAQRDSTGGQAPGADAAVTHACKIMAAHIEEPLPCDAIAERVGLSLRQIERRFQRGLRCSVLQHYRQIRMAKAHQLLQQTHLGVTEVALSCGFASPEYFCRLYRAQFKCSPSRDRRQSITAPVLRRGAARIARRRHAAPLSN